MYLAYLSEKPEDWKGPIDNDQLENAIPLLNNLLRSYSMLH